MNIIEIYELTKEFNGLKAVDGVSFAVKKGEIFGFLGPNGSGKTTTINMLTTLLLPTSGTAKVNGHNILEAQTEVRRSIGIVSQEIVLENDLTARENLQFHADLYNVPKKDA
ncbi:MAG: ATP-binding cassette domain-containing protein, partial [Candidatus Hydrothermarchaeota archaeon]|nr:ATP-binding cassette domain-containing protein [Candidatus Hydrothermarchaeota archaeon]